MRVGRTSTILMLAAIALTAGTRAQVLNQHFGLRRTKQIPDAIKHMKEYLLLVPGAIDAEAA